MRKQLRFLRELITQPEFGLPVFALLVSAIAGAIDVEEDRAMGLSLQHYALEVVISAWGLLTAFWLLARFVRARRSEEQLKTQLQEGLQRSAERDLALNSELKHWKQTSHGFSRGLAFAIEEQFTRWQLSRAESEIALLALKGFALKEIAGLRDVSERTVRQQITSVYSKSNLRGRAELSAFFLEDLLAPSTPLALENSSFH